MYHSRLHMQNLDLIMNHSNEAVNKFGFHNNVCCGKIPIDNSWNDDWVVSILILLYLDFFMLS